MAMDTSDVLDLSKENIQPLRQGRKAAHLKTALQAQTDPHTQQMLQRTREEYEYKIRMYEGDDPLEPYYSYVIWLEQSFPKMGRESNLVALLEDTLIKFKDCDKYKQDQRLVQLLVKYIGVQSNPLELYQLVYDQGLGTMCSLLYKAWAEELDKINDIKRADQVFKLGISCRAQPMNELENAHVQFQLSIARRMIDGSLNNAPPADESHRSILSKLKPSKVKTTRAIKDTAGVLPTAKGATKLSNVAAPKFQVYSEDETDGPSRSDTRKTEKFPKGSMADRENVMQPSKWCGQKQRQSYKMSLVPTTPSFQIHEDPEAEYQSMKSDFKPRALKVRRDDFNPPVAAFEPPDPTKKPMYPKQMVYVGGRDIQLEEIRAAFYLKKLEKLEKERLKQCEITDFCDETVHVEEGSPQQRQEAGSFAQQENNIKTTGETNDVSFQSFHPVKQDNARSPANTATQTAGKEITSLPSTDVAQLPAEGFNSAPRETAQQSSKDFGPFPPPFGKPNSSMLRHSPSTSMTVNTRNAFLIIDEMWKSDSSQNGDEIDNFLPQSASKTTSFPAFPKPENPAPRPKINSFPVFCDESTTDARTEEPFNVFSDFAAVEKKSTAFDVYCDDLLTDAGKKPSTSNAYRNPFAVFCDDDTPKESTTKDLFSFDVNAAAKAKQDLFASHSSGAVTKSAPIEPRCDSLPKNGNGLFAVFCDENEGGENSRKEAENSSKSAKLKITCKDYFDDDEELARPMCSLKIPTPESRHAAAAENTPLPLIVKVDLEEKPLGPEDKENMAPKDYSTPSERRPLSGILTPATNVPVKEYQSDESDDEDNRVYGRHLDFDDETCTTRAFAIPLPTSTPFARPEASRSARKNSIYDGSDISELKNSRKMSLHSPNLSLILENSKENRGSSASSSSSGNAGSTVRTYCTPFM